VVAEGADGDWIVFSREERYFVPWINWQSFGRITVETHVSLINLKVHRTPSNSPLAFGDDRR
jgi:hypothetical protein